jgi:aspartate/methionine/tyrosine aminotransferase
LHALETLSRRGRRLLDSPPTPDYLREHFERRDRHFHVATCPDGYIPLCIAENKLVADLLLPKLEACRAVPEAALGYDSMIGARVFREALARFMGERFLKRTFQPEQLAVLSGAGSVLEILFHVIADPGDAVLVPTPSYAGFWPDLTTRDELTIVPVHTSSDDGFQLNVDLLDAALASSPRPVRALLFTSPDNPLGRVYSKDELEEVLSWAERTGVHLVMDEIYALSVFGDRPFVSAASLRSTLGERVHIVWAFSKDFAMSGARVGVLVSENEAVLQAADALAYWAACSGPIQHLLANMITDDEWVSLYLRTTCARLEHAYQSVTAALDSAGIPYLPSSAGFFVLLDLRRFLHEPSWDAEQTLWRRFLAEANVNVTPGAACRIAEPGFMRLCFAGVDTATAVHGVRALGRVLNG